MTYSLSEVAFGWRPWQTLVSYLSTCEKHIRVLNNQTNSTKGWHITRIIWNRLMLVRQNPSQSKVYVVTLNKQLLPHCLVLIFTIKRTKKMYYTLNWKLTKNASIVVAWTWFKLLSRLLPAFSWQETICTFVPTMYMGVIFKLVVIF